MYFKVWVEEMVVFNLEVQKDKDKSFRYNDLFIQLSDINMGERGKYCYFEVI